MGQAITGGALYENHMVTVDPIVLGELEDVARRFVPPKWPGTINMAMANHGESVFIQKCGSMCHDDTQTPRDVGTDVNAATIYAGPMKDGMPFVVDAPTRLKAIKNL